eukprot:COSAG02_NODE_54732_length_294_cov_1.061538_1_plen_43_part_10
MEEADILVVTQRAPLPEELERVLQAARRVPVAGEGAQELQQEG